MHRGETDMIADQELVVYIHVGFKFKQNGVSAHCDLCILKKRYDRAEFDANDLLLL